MNESILVERPHAGLAPYWHVFWLIFPVMLYFIILLQLFSLPAWQISPLLISLATLPALLLVILYFSATTTGARFGQKITVYRFPRRPLELDYEKAKVDLILSDRDILNFNPETEKLRIKTKNHLGVFQFYVSREEADRIRKFLAERKV